MWVGFGLVLMFCNLGLFGCCLLLKSAGVHFCLGLLGLCCAVCSVARENYSPPYIKREHRSRFGFLRFVASSHSVLTFLVN